MSHTDILATLALTAGIASCVPICALATPSRPDGLVHVAVDTKWRAWLNRHYPSRSSSWPEPAAKAFKALEGAADWDYIGKGDYDADSAPSAVLIKFAPGKKASLGVMSRFTVYKWRDGKWTELVDLDAEHGAKLNGEGDEDLNCQDGYLLDLVLGNRKSQDRPGLSFFLELANKNGQGMSDAAQLYYSRKTGKYALSAE